MDGPRRQPVLEDHVHTIGAAFSVQMTDSPTAKHALVAVAVDVPEDARPPALVEPPVAEVRPRAHATDVLPLSWDVGTSHC